MMRIAFLYSPELALNYLYFIFSFMKKILISTLAVASIVLFSSCTMPGQKEEKKTDAMMPAENTMMRDADAMMKKEDADEAMMKKDDTTADGMMKADVDVESGAMMQK